MRYFGARRGVRADLRRGCPQAGGGVEPLRAWKRSGGSRRADPSRLPPPPAQQARRGGVELGRTIGRRQAGASLHLPVDLARGSRAGAVAGPGDVDQRRSVSRHVTSHESLRVTDTSCPRQTHRRAQAAHLKCPDGQGTPSQRHHEYRFAGAPSGGSAAALNGAAARPSPQLGRCQGRSSEGSNDHETRSGRCPLIGS